LRDFGDARERRRRNERDVAEADERHAVGFKRGERHAGGVTGAARRRLPHEHHVGGRKRRLDGVRAVPGDDDDRAWHERAHGVQHVRGEGPAGEAVENLRQRGMHPLALACGKENDVEGGGHRKKREPRG
jgi:hypothetical protein